MHLAYQQSSGMPQSPFLQQSKQHKTIGKLRSRHLIWIQLSHTTMAELVNTFAQQCRMTYKQNLAQPLFQRALVCVRQLLRHGSAVCS